MDLNTECIKIALSNFIESLRILMEDTYKHLAVLLIFMIIDTILGWIKVIKKGNWTARKARYGFYAKVVEWLIIIVLYCLDWLHNSDTFSYVGLYYFIIVEIASILENYGYINGNLPAGLTELMKKIKTNFGSIIVKKAEKVLEDFYEEEKTDKNQENKNN